MKSFIICALNSCSCSFNWLDRLAYSNSELTSYYEFIARLVGLLGRGIGLIHKSADTPIPLRALDLVAAGIVFPLVQSITRVTKSSRMGWAGHVVRMGEKIFKKKFVGSPQGKEWY